MHWTNAEFPYDFLFHHERVPYVFLAIPKVGCTTVKSWLIANCAGLDTSSMDVHDYAYHHFSLATRPNGRDVLSRFPVVGFVRPPAERLRSAFIDKLVAPESFGPFDTGLWFLTHHAAAHGKPGPDLDRRVTFRECVEHVCRTDPMALESHWRPQHSFVQAVSELALPALVKLRAISDVLEAIGRECGLPAPRPEPTSVTRKEPAAWGGKYPLADLAARAMHRLDLRPDLHELLVPEIAEQIARTLGADEELFARATDRVDVASPFNSQHTNSTAGDSSSARTDGAFDGH